MMLLELGAVGLLFCRMKMSLTSEVPMNQPEGTILSSAFRIFLVLVVALPLIQLMPVPMGLWAKLPGREFYANAIGQALASPDGLNWRSVSLIPSATESALLSLLPPLAVFLVALKLDSDRLHILVFVFLGVAAVDGLLGMVQYSHGWKYGSGTGTYNNRNHLAGLLEMALPVGLALLASTVGHHTARIESNRHGKRHRRRKLSLRQWLARFSVERFHQTTVLAALSLAILLGLIFTRSRAGIALGMLGILLCTLMFSFRLGGRKAYGLTGTFTFVGIGVASTIGLAPVWSRFASTDFGEDGRWGIFGATVRAIGEFFPLGSGAGTFVEVMHRFHPLGFMPGLYINHAHNDYLEWLLEFGLIAGALLVLWLILFLGQWGRILMHGEWTSFRFIQAGAGIALILMMLHSLVDFNLRIPANVVITAFLAGVFFHRQSTEKRSHVSRRANPEEGLRNAVSDYSIPPENQKNPFGVGVSSP
jgi:O-antigen ligase